MSKTITVKLRTPVEAGGQRIDKLVLREPTVGDMLTAEAVGGGELRQSVALLASMAGVEMEVMQRITRADFTRITEAAAPLLEDSAGEDEGPRETPAVASAA